MLESNAGFGGRFRSGFGGLLRFGGAFASVVNMTRFAVLVFAIFVVNVSRFAVLEFAIFVVNVSRFAVLEFAIFVVHVSRFAVRVFAIFVVHVSRFAVLEFAIFVVNVSVRAVGAVNVAGFAVRRGGRWKFAAENEERARASNEKKKERDDGYERGRSLVFVVFHFGHLIRLFLSR